MSLRTFGVRYERLLMFSAPLSFACILLAFVSVASGTAADYQKALCYENSARAIEPQPEWEKQWGIKRIVGKEGPAVELPSPTLGPSQIPLVPPDCYRLFPELEKPDPQLSRSELGKKLRDASKRLKTEVEKRPIESYGVEIPEKATLALMGTNIRINTRTLIQILQFVLGPVLMLWLGTLYNTRYRETRLIESAVAITDLYPHSINIYLIGTMLTLRKHSRVVYHLKCMIPFLPAIVRIAILSVFILPPTFFYCISLFYHGSGIYLPLVPVAGVVVVIFTLCNLVAEFNPWHCQKLFPSAKCFDASRYSPD
jgi:hypothetical protein